MDNAKNHHPRINFEVCKMGNKKILKGVEGWALKVGNFIKKQDRSRKIKNGEKLNSPFFRLSDFFISLPP